MTKLFLRIARKPLTQTTNSRYDLPVDNYAKAPLRRLFHFLAVSGRTDISVRRFVCYNLHTLVLRCETSFVLSRTCTLFKKHRGVYPTHFESPLPTPAQSGHPRPVAAIASQIARLSTESRQNQPASSRLVIQDASHNRKCRELRRSILTCNKKAISPTLTGNAPPTNAVNVVIHDSRINLQETDR